ncbi:MAG: TIM barrel protein [Nanoarchaeota archaeon]
MTLNISLGINTGFALNRYPTAEGWTRVVREDLDLDTVQFTADLLNASLPADIIEAQILDVQKWCKKRKITVEHTFTSAFTRVNHLSHPDPKIREYWIEWFKRFATISARLGATSMGSHFGILGVDDLKDPERRGRRLKENIEGWHRIAAHAKNQGLKYLCWEPMSIPREYGETLEETRRIHQAVNDGISLPMKLCLDVDHGDVSSAHPDDTDPYAWLRTFGAESPIIHIKQSTKNKGGHWPFIKEINEQGRIQPDLVFSALEESEAHDILLLLELSFREREPAESNMIMHLRESVEFWKKAIESYNSA